MTIDSVDIRQAVADYYGRTLASHGPTSRGVDWRDTSSHQLRHSQFLRLIGDDRDASIADLGCGYGDFLSFLRQAGHRGDYHGYDVVPAMIASAVSVHQADARAAWTVGHCPAPADYVIASGLFNVKQDFADHRWEEYVFETMETMASVARRGWAVNVLSCHSDPDRQRSDLYYGDPVEWLRRATERHGRRVAVLQDYALYEFTLIVRRDA